MRWHCPPRRAATVRCPAIPCCAVGEGVKGDPIWDVVATYLRDKKTIRGVKLNEPKIVGVGKKNPGIAGYKGGLS